MAKTINKMRHKNVAGPCIGVYATLDGIELSSWTNMVFHFEISLHIRMGF